MSDEFGRQPLFCCFSVWLFASVFLYLVFFSSFSSQREKGLFKSERFLPWLAGCYELERLLLVFWEFDSEVREFLNDLCWSTEYSVT